MRVKIHTPYITVRAGISDFLFSLPLQHLKTEVADEPGVTQFHFRDQSGELGYLRIHVIRDDETMFTTYHPDVVHEKGLFDLMLAEKVFIEPDDFEILTPILQVAAMRKKDGVDNWDINDYFHAAVQHRSRPLITEQEREDAAPVIDKYLQRMNAYKQEQHRTIIDAIIYDLLVQELWTLSKPTLTQSEDENANANENTHNETDSASLFL